MNLPYDLSLKLVGRYGALPASRPGLSEDQVIAVPFEFAVDPSQFTGLKVGLFVHIFYPELCAEIAQALANIPVKFDLFISTDSAEKKVVIAHSFESFSSGRCTIEVFPNRGRDIAPFIVGFRGAILEYDIICHLHSKNSKHDDILFGWREYLFGNLCGSPAIVASILFALRSGDVDLLFPDHYGPVRQSLNYGYDYEHLRHLLGRVGVPFTKDILLEFPSGSMFWARCEALELLLDLDLKFEDFPEEQGQIDGTLAHAIERAFVFLAEAGGRRWAKIVSQTPGVDSERVITVCNPDDLPLAVTRASRRLLGNRVSANLRQRSIEEVPAVGFRPELSLRPRFTLLIPTLRPEKAFGGIATALRLFEQLLANLGKDVDARIVSLTDDVAPECLDSVEGYTLISLDAANTELPRTIVDASGVPSEQLPIRRKEVFLATAWWTAYCGFQARDIQESLYSFAPPLFYFIQDHEPEFYGWSSRYALARSTYLRPTETKAIVNSEELYNFFEKTYGFQDAYVVPYNVNERLRRGFRAVPKERIILIYGRPSTPRNAFELLVNGLCLWQQGNPIVARDWRIISVGEFFEPWRAQDLSNFEVVGKLPLEDYADVLCRAAIGISLMISPHPSYPPLEMAEAGMITLTNKYGAKDLSLRSRNIIAIDLLTPGRLADQIDRAVCEAGPMIGHLAQFSAILPVSCYGKAYSAFAVASSVMSYL